MVDISSELRAFGVSDMKIIGIDPHSGDLSEWRVAAIKRGCSIAQLLVRETHAMSRPGMATIRPVPAPKPKLPKAAMPGHTTDQLRAAQIMAHVKRMANRSMWTNEMETRDGLVLMTEAAKRLGKSFDSVRSALRNGRFPGTATFCPFLGREVKMVRLEDVDAWARGT